MPRRANSFDRALKDAEKRMEKAQAELTDAQNRIAELSTEIPRLRQIIASLSGKVVPSERDSTGFSNTRNSAVTGEHRAETSAVPPANMTPEELAKWYLDRDLSSVGSVPPAKPVEPSAPVDEDALLPDDFEVKN